MKLKENQLYKCKHVLYSVYPLVGKRIDKNDIFCIIKISNSIEFDVSFYALNKMGIVKIKFNNKNNNKHYFEEI